MEWYHVCWPRLTAKRVEPVVSISWASCFFNMLLYADCIFVMCHQCGIISMCWCVFLCILIFTLFLFLLFILFFYGIFYGFCSPIQIKMMLICNYRNVRMISECHSMSSAIQRRTCHDFILMQVVCINQCTVSDTLILSRIKILDEFEQSFNYSPSTAVFVIRYTIIDVTDPLRFQTDWRPNLQYSLLTPHRNMYTTLYH